MTSQGNSACSHAALPSRINKQLSAQGSTIDPVWEFDAYGNDLRWLYLQKTGSVRAGIFSHFPWIFFFLFLFYFILFFLSRHTYRQCASESTGLLSCSFCCFLTMWFLLLLWFFSLHILQPISYRLSFYFHALVEHKAGIHGIAAQAEPQLKGILDYRVFSMQKKIWLFMVLSSTEGCSSFDSSPNLWQ